MHPPPAHSTARAALFTYRYMSYEKKSTALLNALRRIESGLLPRLLPSPTPISLLHKTHFPSPTKSLTTKASKKTIEKSGLRFHIRSDQVSPWNMV